MFLQFKENNLEKQPVTNDVQTARICFSCNTCTFNCGGCLFSSGSTAAKASSNTMGK